MILFIKGVSSILLQIPFFLAAYNFLSGADVFTDIRFNYRYDYLYAPDELIKLSGISINLLPILMTLINILSGLIYTHGKEKKDRINIIILPLVFLILLYNSPAGLVVYWIFNNLFSLCRNIHAKTKQKTKGKQLKASDIRLIVILILTVICISFGMDGLSTKAANYVSVFICAPLLLLPLFLPENKKSIPGKPDMITLILKELFLLLFISVYLPLDLINSCPTDFFLSGETLWDALRYPLLYGAGFLLIWLNLFYFLFKNRQNTIHLLLSFSCILAVADHLLFSNNSGVMNVTLHYETVYMTGFIPVIASLILFEAIYFILRYHSTTIAKKERPFIIIMLLTVSILCCREISTIKKEIRGTMDSTTEDSLSRNVSDTPICLSRNHKNVIVIMLDRAIGPYIPYIMAENPALKDKFDGFTYYKNTVTTGSCTVLGSPGLFGGYEYAGITFYEDHGATIADRYNESLKVLPVLFDQNNYRCILSGLPYAGYSNVSDMSIFDEYPDIETYIFEKLLNSEYKLKNNDWDLSKALLSYGLFKASPHFLQNYAYYYVCEGYEDTCFNVPFIQSYNVLDHLSSMTSIQEDDDKGCFIEFDNNLTHEPTYLQLPEYILPEDGEIDNSAYLTRGNDRYLNRDMIPENIRDSKGYHTNAAAFRMLGAWFDHLREIGVYDNTRIIIASDHGYLYGDYPELIYDKYEDMEVYCCTLMVKDFNATGFTVSDELMTSADVPALAVKAIIEKPVNPFTGQDLLRIPEKSRIPLVSDNDFMPVYGNKKCRRKYYFAYTVSGDILEIDSWQKVKPAVNP